MHPEIWSPSAWNVIHLFAIGYPKQPTYEDIISYKNFYENFWKVMPCYKCSVNFRKNIKDIPIDEYLTDNIKLFEWTVKLHNLVNREIGKPETSLEDAMQRYSKIIKNSKEKKEVEDGKKMFVWIFIFIVIAIVIYIIYTSNSSVYIKIRDWFKNNINIK